MKIKRIAAGAAVLAVAALATNIVPASASTAAEQINGGSLAFVSTPPNITFSATTLNGTNQTASGTMLLDVNDPTGSNAGWNITLSGTSWAGPTGANLSNTSATVTGAVNNGCDASSTCTLATNSVSYAALTVPLGSSPTPAKIYNAAVNTGEGEQNMTLSYNLAVPANTTAGAYTSTWTVTLASAP